MLPRIPLVDDMKDFWAFSKAGRELADMHLNYEKVPKHKEVREVIVGTGYKITNNMKFGRIDGGKDKSKIIYNSHITLENIPLVAYEYIVNGKSAIEWIMDRYCISQDKKSGIINDANDWCEEVGNPRYIIDLLHSIINLSVKTVEIVNNLPKIKFED
jgi:predicted helicase